MNKKKVRGKLLSAFIAVGIFAGACSLTSSSISNTPVMIYADDFSDPESGWLRHRAEGITDYEAGMYRIMVEFTDYFSSSLANLSLGDLILEVDVAYAGSADLGEMGIICRWKDAWNHYLFTIRSDGYFAIFKMIDNVQHYIGMDGYQFSPSIRTGMTTNHLRVECIGNMLSFYVNDTLLVTVEDSSEPVYFVGDVGLVGGSYNQPNVNVLFDNFTIYQP